MANKKSFGVQDKMKNIKDILIQHNQQHLIPVLESLRGDELARFEKQIEQIDWDTVDLWKHPEDLSGKGRVEPINGLTCTEIRQNRDKFLQAGVSALQAGKVGAVLLAGGQGTRLGSDAPKGAYDIGITHPVYIFERLIANLKDVCLQCGCNVPLFVMTSDLNDGATREFLSKHDYFGYPEQFVRFFTQDMAPVVDFEGKLMLESPTKAAFSPNGNGGWYSSLVKARVLNDFPDIEWLNVFSVDNVLQRIADPIFVGATILSGTNCGAKVVRKCDPYEKVGVLCLEDGISSVIEYYEMTDEMANATDSQGNLAYSFGVILNYLFNLEKLHQTAGKHIPVHVVKKKVPVLDSDGNAVKPAAENAYKFETLILDMVRLMETCLPFEVVREREFAPIKNKTGVDSVESARKLLQFNGVEI